MVSFPLVSPPRPYTTPSPHPYAPHARPIYLLTPRCRVPLEQLTGLQLVKKFPAFHGTRRFITAFTSVRHLSLSWASPIQSIYPHPILLKIRPNIIHPSTPRPPQWSLSPWFPPSKTLYTNHKRYFENTYIAPTTEKFPNKIIV